MKKIKIRTLLFTGMACLLPMILGIILYKELPQQMAVHFNIHNEPDMFFPKEFAVFGIPIFMFLLQVVMCIINDLGPSNNKPDAKLNKIVKLIIPAMTIILYPVTIAYALGAQADIRRLVCFTLGIIIALTGNYLPKISFEQSKGLNTTFRAPNESVWRKISRSTGYTFMITGVLLAASILLPAAVSVAALIVMFISMAAVTIYSIRLARQ